MHEFIFPNLREVAKSSDNFPTFTSSVISLSGPLSSVPGRLTYRAIKRTIISCTPRAEINHSTVGNHSAWSQFFSWMWKGSFVACYTLIPGPLSRAPCEKCEIMFLEKSLAPKRKEKLKKLLFLCLPFLRIFHEVSGEDNCWIFYIIFGLPSGSSFSFILKKKIIHNF